MRHLFRWLIIIAFAATACSQTAPIQLGSRRSPKEVVEEFWSQEVAGDLMTPQAWQRAITYLWAEPPKILTPDKIIVIFNGWAAEERRLKADTAEVMVEFLGVGSIDSALQFSPRLGMFSGQKANVMYGVVFTQTYMTTTYENGKTEKAPVGMEWRIRGAHITRFMTVNAAIRYVLQSERKSTDPQIKRNADRTLAILLRVPNG